MQTLFISDLHLSPGRPDITHAFKQFMRQKAAEADALYVLGDLFDFWVGDDDPTAFAQEIKHEFKQLTSAGIPCYFIHGNRDFLLGSRFARDTGVMLLDEESVIELYGQKVILLHGDTLCLDDVGYLQFREKVHRPWLQKLYRCLPFKLKQYLVSRIQQDARMDKQTKALDIMDVTQSEVERVMAVHHVNIMIHGHTHRPDVHRFSATGQEKIRIVLGDWDKEMSVLVYDNKANYQLCHQIINDIDSLSSTNETKLALHR